MTAILCGRQRFIGTTTNRWQNVRFHRSYMILRDRLYRRWWRDRFICLSIRCVGGGWRRSSTLSALHTLLSLAQHMRLATCESLRWPSFELHRAPGTTLYGCLELCFARITEARAHAEEILPSWWSFYWCTQPKKWMMLDGTLPQVLTCLLIVQSTAEWIDVDIVMSSFISVFCFLFTVLCIAYLNMKQCSNLAPSSSSSTTIRVSFFFLKSNLLIFCQKNRPIFASFSNTRMPVGVKPKW